MSKYMLDLVRNLITTRDELAEVEAKINYLRRKVDGLANDLVDRVTAATFEVLAKDADGSEFDSSEVEQPVVDRSGQKGGTGADDFDESRDAL